MLEPYPKPLPLPLPVPLPPLTLAMGKGAVLPHMLEPYAQPQLPLTLAEAVAVGVGAQLPLLPQPKQPLPPLPPCPFLLWRTSGSPCLVAVSRWRSAEGARQTLHSESRAKLT